MIDVEFTRTRWKGYFQLLLNVENDAKEHTEGPLQLYSVVEVRKQLGKMGLTTQNKAWWPVDRGCEDLSKLQSGPPHRNDERCDARRNAKQLENN